MEALRDTNILRRWCADLVRAIDLKAFGDPILAHFATHSDAACGYSLIQLVETSSITAHFAENIGEAYIDIFSCKEFDAAKALNLCKSVFQPSCVCLHHINRGMRKA
jgi:S-adenosylmethionine/arginine decarboxylase-like enzyme